VVPLPPEVRGRLSGDRYAEALGPAGALAAPLRHARCTTIRAPASLIVALVLTLAALPVRAAGIDCAKAATPTERAVCGDPELRKLDASIATDFAEALAATQGATRQALLAQQRRWLSQRDHGCKGDDAACLRSSYEARFDALEALTARVSPGNPTLPDVTAVALLGRWKIGDNLVPAAPDQRVPAADVPAYLPKPGSTIVGQAGKLCSGNGECLPFGLDQQELGMATGTEALHLPPATPFYVAYLSGKSAYALIRRPDGSLLAQFQVCDKTYTSCTNAFQVWTPVSPDAGVRVLAH
jgi:uncharacterized protein YecT (DUF1311 family)